MFEVNPKQKRSTVEEDRNRRGSVFQKRVRERPQLSSNEEREEEGRKEKGKKKACCSREMELQLRREEKGESGSGVEWREGVSW